ncbi:hypothetical protein [Shewanella gelidii]|uniref:Uncharacterized protein n=1 Tax=Shewanella gelidii TaxID=1642821 RepID=A0A917JPD3_9GAMM|nr:hypothetical protein [Shewanella gelidii]MCL1097862.1 hypothetical protein [Shewanella gelidii]GGI78172.1 hypothetical protein GCM10009332_14440 [Shewanella gelidii]
MNNLQEQNERLHIQLAQTESLLEEAISMLESMSCELRFRGCENNHKLVRRARIFKQRFEEDRKL